MSRRYTKDSVQDDIDHEEDIDYSVSHRCPNCGSCGGKGIISPGTLLEIQCRRCKKKYVLKGI